MHIVDPQGRRVCAGAIDDKRSASLAETKHAKNHVRAALNQVLAGNAITIAATSPYGCAVKYGPPG